MWGVRERKQNRMVLKFSGRFWGDERKSIPGTGNSRKSHVVSACCIWAHKNTRKGCG